MKSNLIEITLELRHETEKAFLVTDGSTIIKKGDTTPTELKVWIPKSQVENNNDGTFTMPEWLALEKGFI
jgi:hypothetical protein